MDLDSAISVAAYVIQSLYDDYLDVTGMTDYDCPTDEMEEYAGRLQDIFVDNILGTVVDDVFSILYMDKNFLYEFNRQCSVIIKY